MFLYTLLSIYYSSTTLCYWLYTPQLTSKTSKKNKKKKKKKKKLASWKIPTLILRILKQCFSVLDFLRKR